MTQSELADAVGVRQATISDLENGNSRRIELDLVEKLTGELGRRLGRRIKPGDLFTFETDKPKGRK